MTDIPAFVRNGRLDILHANALAQVLYSEHYRDPVRPPNSARFAFLDQRAHDIVPQIVDILLGKHLPHS